MPLKGKVKSLFVYDLFNPFPNWQSNPKVENFNGKDLKLIILQLNDFTTFNFDATLRNQINITYSFA